MSKAYRLRRPGSSGQGPAGESSRQDRAAGSAGHARRLVGEASGARASGDRARWSRAVAGLAAEPGAPGWQQEVSRALLASLQAAAGRAWQQGWQPAELARHAGRVLGGPHRRMAIDAIAAKMREYPAAAVDSRWQAQLTAVGADAWWGGDSGWLGRWAQREGLGRAAAVTCALDLLAVLASLPALAVLCPPPGTTREGPGAVTGPGAGGWPGGQAGGWSGGRALNRIRALLAKAESTEFPEEAEALTIRAQELMARYRIDAAVLAAGTGPAGRDGPGGRRLFVDSPYEPAKVTLVNVVARANRCRAVQHPQLGLVTVVGFPADLDAVELLFTSLLVQGTTAMVAAGPKRDRYGRSRTRAFRHAFLASYAGRIGERLREAARWAEREAGQEAAAGVPGTSLLPVLAAREQAVEDAVSEMFPRLACRPGTSISDYEGWAAGRAAADTAALHGCREVSGAT
jgi:hypothetical protein